MSLRTVANHVSLKISPAPQNIRESKEIYKHLKTYGDIQYFRTMRHENTTKEAKSSVRIVYKTEDSMQNVLRSSPFTFSIPSPPPPSANQTRDTVMLANAYTPPPIASFTIEATKTPYDHGAFIKNKLYAQMPINTIDGTSPGYAASFLNVNKQDVSADNSKAVSKRIQELTDGGWYGWRAEMQKSGLEGWEKIMAVTNTDKSTSLLDERKKDVWGSKEERERTKSAKQILSMLRSKKRPQSSAATLQSPSAPTPSPETSTQSSGRSKSSSTSTHPSEESSYPLHASSQSSKTSSQSQVMASEQNQNSDLSQHSSNEALVDNATSQPVSTAHLTAPSPSQDCNDSISIEDATHNSDQATKLSATEIQPTVTTQHAQASAKKVYSTLNSNPENLINPSIPAFIHLKPMQNAANYTPRTPRKANAAEARLASVFGTGSQQPVKATSPSPNTRANPQNPKSFRSVSRLPRESWQGNGQERQPGQYSKSHFAPQSPTYTEPSLAQPIRNDQNDSSPNTTASYPPQSDVIRQPVPDAPASSFFQEQNETQQKSRYMQFPQGSLAGRLRARQQQVHALPDSVLGVIQGANKNSQANNDNTGNPLEETVDLSIPLMKSVEFDNDNGMTALSSQELFLKGMQDIVKSDKVSTLTSVLQASPVKPPKDPANNTARSNVKAKPVVKAKPAVKVIYKERPEEPEPEPEPESGKKKSWMPSFWSGVS